MNHLDFKSFRVVNNNLALHLALILGTMLVTGLAGLYAGKLLFFWAPKRVKQDVSTTVGVVGVLAGLWFAVKWFLK